MGCIVNLKEDVVPALPANGSWIYQGYNADQESGPWGANPVASLIAFSPGTIINLPTIQLDTTLKTPGYYALDYVYGNSSTRIVLSIISATITAGVNKQINISQSSSPVDLLAQLGATIGGVWTDVDNAGSSFVNGVLDPSALAIGTYRFRYDLSKGDDTLSSCTTCANLLSEITVNITTGITGDIVLSTTSATYTLELVHPDSGVNNRAKYVSLDDSLTWQILTRKLVKRNDVTIQNEIINIHGLAKYLSVLSDQPAVWLGVRISSHAPLQVGGYLQYITLIDSVTNTESVNVPLAPSGTYQAVFSGSAGTVTANDLVFNGTNGKQMIEAIKIAFNNYMNTIGAVEGVNYYFGPENIYSSTDAPVKFFCAIKNNPANLWYGIASLTYRGAPSFIDNTTYSQVSGSSWFAMSSNYGQSCPRLWYYPYTPIFDYNVNYFSIEFTEDAQLVPVIISPKPGSILTSVCTESVLTVNIEGCSGTLSYLWNTGETTQSIVAMLPGTYTVQVTCTNPAETIILSYVKT